VIKYHSHSGFYNDGNSRYVTEDRILDVEAGTLTIRSVESLGGQLAGNHQFAHKENVTEEAREAVPFSVEQEDAIWRVLEPLVETARKYPHLETFRFFSDKHRWFVKGRIDKAVRLAGDSDYHGVYCLKDVFALPKHGVVLTAYYEDTYKRSYWKFKVESLGGRR